MKCGCASQGVTADGKPVCLTHLGILPGAEERAPVSSLEGRFALCGYCGSKRPSDLTLPFFEFGTWNKGERRLEQDSFYCGCRGWD